MDYEKKIREYLNNGNVDELYKSMLLNLFPELKESEDERIRKGLIKAVSRTLKGNTLFGTDVTREEALAWLEKQGEQKPVIKMETPEESLGISSEEYNKIVDECIYGDDKSAWSEEDERTYKSVLYAFEHNYPLNNEQQKFIKSLKERIKGE